MGCGPGPSRPHDPRRAAPPVRRPPATATGSIRRPVRAARRPSRPARVGVADGEPTRATRAPVPTRCPTARSRAAVGRTGPGDHRGHRSAGGRRRRSPTRRRHGAGRRADPRPQPPSAGRAARPAPPPRPVGPRPPAAAAGAGRAGAAQAQRASPPLVVLEGTAAAHRGGAGADLPDPDVPGQGLRDPVRVDGDDAARLRRLQQRPGAGRQDQLPVRRAGPGRRRRVPRPGQLEQRGHRRSSRATRWSAACSCSGRWSGWRRRTRRTSSSG